MQHDKPKQFFQLEAISIASPNYFSVSCLKLFLMSICTFGLYDLYWQYKNWCLIKEREKLKIMPFWRAFFAYFFCYSLFKKIQSSANLIKTQKTFSAGELATGWILVTLMWRLPGPFGLLTFCSVFFLLPVQKVANDINYRINPKQKLNKSFTAWNIVALAIGGTLFFLDLIASFIPA